MRVQAEYNSEMLKKSQFENCRRGSPTETFGGMVEVFEPIMKKNQKPTKTDWHRIWYMMVSPLFERLGCNIIVEMDLSAKAQKVSCLNFMVNSFSMKN